MSATEEQNQAEANNRLLRVKRWAEMLGVRAERIANHRWAEGLVFLLETLASTALPIPNSLTMVGLVTAAPRKWVRFGLSLTCGSVAGGALLYIIGRGFFSAIGQSLITFYGAQARWATIDTWFNGWWGVLFILVAGLGTGLFRVACLGAGFTAMNPPLFFLLLVLSRSARWLTACGAISYIGERVRSWPVHYFKYATIGLGFLFLLSILLTLKN